MSGRKQISLFVDCPNQGCGQPVEVANRQGTEDYRCHHCGCVFQYPIERSFVIFDLETTGLSARHCEIIQIAAVRFRGGKAVRDDTFFSYCRPASRVPRFITQLTGVTNQDVADAPRPIEVLRRFSAFVGDSVIMAHNGHRFDVKFLEETCQRENTTTRSVESIDTIAFSKKVFGTRRGTGHGLDRVLDRLGINVYDYARHDARGDIAALADAVSAMWSQLGFTDDCPGIRKGRAVLPAGPRVSGDGGRGSGP